jgi:hypothetical protein
VLTLDYWRLANDLRPGDYVFDRNGKVVQIKLAQAYRANNCYEIMFDDKLTLQGDDKLRLPLEDLKYRQRSDEYRNYHPFKRQLKVKSVSSLLEEPLTNHRNRQKHSVPTAKPLQFPHQALPVPPFIFGFWFFNQRYNGCCVPAAGNSEFIHNKFRDAGFKVRTRRLAANKEYEFSTTPTVRSHLAPRIPTKIPNNYLLSSPEQRFDLLQGILYARSSRYNKKTKQCRFSSKHLELATQVQYLAESLGCRTRMIFDKTKPAYAVFIKTKLIFFPEHQTTSTSVHQARRIIESITPIEPQACVHIETNGEDNTILVGEGFISCL